MVKRTNTNPHIALYHFKRNKYFPNSCYPVLIYRRAMLLPSQKNKAVKIVQHIFSKNKWSNSWQNGIYSFHHYHSNTDECMAICKGNAVLILGGTNGRQVTVKQGDVIILPAGTGHKCKKASKDFLCVGAYPQGKDYDTLIGKKGEITEALKNISQLPVPVKDPVYGKPSFLHAHWK